jgi:hypothetical protein
MAAADDARSRDPQRTAAASVRPLRIGDWLVHRRLVSRYQLLLALKRAYHRRCRLGDAVVALRFLGRDDVEAEVLAMTSFNALLRPPEHAAIC